MNGRLGADCRGRSISVSQNRNSRAPLKSFKSFSDAVAGQPAVYMGRSSPEGKDNVDKEERYENRQWNDAVRDAKRAYDQLSKFDWKAWDGKPESAARHLRKALDDFSAAMTHVEKADVGKAQKGAVDDVNRGIKQLDEAVTALDDGNLDSAQRHYDNAANDFDKAAAILV